MGFQRPKELDSFLDGGIQAYMSCRSDPGLLKVIDLTWQLSDETARQVEKIASSSKEPISSFFIDKKWVNTHEVLVFPCHSALDAESIKINLQI